MEQFGYVAIDSSGAQKKGNIVADTRDQAFEMLKRNGLIPMEIRQQSILNRDININIGGYPKPRDLSVMCRQFVSMTQAGVPIIAALNMLSEQTENKRLAFALSETQKTVEKGESLSMSMRAHKKIFPELLVNMVEAGERTGSMDIAFERMAVQFEREARLTALIKKAMVYPIVVCIVALVVVFVMLTRVIPSYVIMFNDLGAELPGITLMVIAMSDFVIEKWYLLIAGAAAIILAIRLYYKTDVGRHQIDKLLLKMPIMGSLMVKSASARFARTMSTMLAAGITVPEALEITSNTMTNVIFKDALMNAREEVLQGVSMSVPLRTSKVFPPMVHHMARIGEEAGDIEGLLTKLAEYYEEEVEIATESLMAAMEPFIIILLAGIVGFLIGAVMAPMLSMYQSLENL